MVVFFLKTNNWERRYSLIWRFFIWSIIACWVVLECFGVIRWFEKIFYGVLEVFLGENKFSTQTSHFLATTVGCDPSDDALSVISVLKK
jgi:hypothetical protein